MAEVFAEYASGVRAALSNGLAGAVWVPAGRTAWLLRLVRSARITQGGAYLILLLHREI